MFTIIKKNELTGILKEGNVFIPPIPLSIEDTGDGFSFNHNQFFIPYHLLNLVETDVIYFQMFEHLSDEQIHEIASVYTLVTPFVFYTEDDKKCCVVDIRNSLNLLNIHTHKIEKTFETTSLEDIGNHLFDSKHTYSFTNLTAITFLQSKIGYFIKPRIVKELDTYKIVEINGEFGLIDNENIYIPCIASSVEYNGEELLFETGVAQIVISVANLPLILNEDLTFKTIQDFGYRVKKSNNKMILESAERTSEAVDFIFDNVFYNEDGTRCIVVFNGLGCFLLNLSTLETIEQTVIINAGSIFEKLITDNDITFGTLTNVKMLRDLRKNYLRLISPFTHQPDPSI